MPSKCSIINCGATSNRNRPNLTFHRLPQSKCKKSIWLKTIGEENIRTDLKHIYICSLHFDENSFNRTLDIIRLKDDAVPSMLIQQPSTLHKSHLTSEDHNKSCKQNVKLFFMFEESAPATIDVNAASHPNIQLDQALKKLEVLQDELCNHKKKIKCLKETVRRQNIRIKSFKHMIKALKENETGDT